MYFTQNTQNTFAFADLKQKHSRRYFLKWAVAETGL